MQDIAMVMKIKNSTTASHRCVLIAMCFLLSITIPLLTLLLILCRVEIVLRDADGKEVETYESLNALVTFDIENTGDAFSQDFLDSQKSTWCTSFYQWTLRGFYKFCLFLKNMFQKKS